MLDKEEGQKSFRGMTSYGLIRAWTQSVGHISRVVIPDFTIKNE